MTTFPLSLKPRIYGLLVVTAWDKHLATDSSGLLIITSGSCLCPEVGTMSVHAGDGFVGGAFSQSGKSPTEGDTVKAATEPERPLIHATEANERWAAYLGDELRGLLEN